MYGAVDRTATPAICPIMGNPTLKPNRSREVHTVRPPFEFRRQEIGERTLVERIFSALVRILFASPPRTRWKKAGYALTLAAVLWQWYVVVMDLYLFWIGIPQGATQGLRNTLFASTENVWTIAQAFTFTFGCVYLLKADKNAHTYREHGLNAEEADGFAEERGFLPRVLPGMSRSLLDHIWYDEEGDDSPSPVTELLCYNSASSDVQVDEDGYPTGNAYERITPSYSVARATFFGKTFLFLLVGYFFVTLALILDAKEQYFFDNWPTRRDYGNMTSGEHVAYWIYFAGFFWGMYSSVAFCCLFIFLCLHLIRSIAIMEQKLVRNKSIQFRNAVMLHERLLRFEKNMADTVSYWFIVNVAMLVIASITIIIRFMYKPEIQCDSRLLYWLSVLAMTVVSSLQLSSPLIAASLVSRRWDNMVTCMAQSGTWLRRGTEYQIFMTYLSMCTPKAGFVLFSGVKISGGIFIRIIAAVAGLIGLFRSLTSDVVS